MYTRYLKDLVATPCGWYLVLNQRCGVSGLRLLWRALYLPCFIDKYRLRDKAASTAALEEGRLGHQGCCCGGQMITHWTLSEPNVQAPQ